MNVLRREKYINFPQTIRIIGDDIKKLCYLLTTPFKLLDIIPLLTLGIKYI